jgi:hypothetical protein
MMRKNPRDIKTEVEWTNDMIDKTDVRNESHKPIDDNVLTDAVKDVASDEEWTEEKEGKISPVENAGKSDYDSSPDPRFSKEHDDDEETLRKNKQKLASAGGGTN